MLVNSTNRTDTVPISPSWEFGPIYSTILCIVTLVNNGTVLWAFFRNRQLRSNPFTCYLMNLMLSNLFHAVTSKPLEIIILLYPGREHTGAFCSAFGHTAAISNSLIIQSHVLITTNRLWAVFFPFTYRRYHSSKTALILCICEWLFVCAFLLPGLLVDGIFLRDTADNVNCQFNIEGHPRQRGWFTAFEIVLFQLPICIVVLAYPLIAWKRHHQAKVGVVVPAMSTSRDAITALSTNGSVHSNTKLRKTRSKSFTVLTLLTCTVLVCYTPLVVFYGTYAIFNVLTPPLFYEVAQALWSTEPALDPIFFSAVFRGVLAEIKRLIKK